MEKIELTIFDLTNQKIKKVYEAFLCLYPKYIHYKVEFKASEPVDEEDESLGWEDVTTCWERVISKGNVSGIELQYKQATKRSGREENIWKVSIFNWGVRDDIDIYFKEGEEKKAVALFDKLISWRYNLQKP